MSKGNEPVRIELFSVFLEMNDLESINVSFKFNGNIYEQEEGQNIQNLLNDQMSDKRDFVRTKIIKHNIEIYRKQLDAALQKNENNLQAEEVQKLSKIVDTLICKLDAKVVSEEVKIYSEGDK